MVFFLFLKHAIVIFKGTRPNIGIGSRRCRSVGCRFFPIPFSKNFDPLPIPFHLVPIISVPNEMESATGQNSSSGQLTEVIKS